MLTQLYIENVAVIERADIAPNRGLTVLTGETGAGKSILIDALAAVLGERTSRELVRTGCSHATVTAVFDHLPDTVKRLLEEQGLEAEEDGTLVLRRRISAENKSACFIGAQPCTASVMRLIGRALVNIHGQHENQTLLSVDRHIEYLDRLGGLDDVRATYESCYRRYCATHRSLKKLTSAEDGKVQRAEMLRFQTSEIDAAALQDGEEEQLVARRDLLHNAEKIARLLQSADRVMNGDEGEGGALSALEQTASLLHEAGRLFSSSQELSTRLHAVLPELQDVAATITNLCDSPEFDPAELDSVEERLALVRKLCGKYGGTVAATLAYAQQAHEELRGIETSDEEIKMLSEKLQREQEVLVEAATALTNARLQAANVFSEAVCEQLAFLDMPRVKLAVAIEKAPMTVSGADRVEFLISANPGEPPKSIAKIASGGELSRIMLALKSVMTSADEIPTLIFDEIDAGISGSAAAKVGYKLRNIASVEGKQVLCVTHLAQIAACAHHHILIEKAVRDDRTYTELHTIDGEERAAEMARIIGGQVTPLSLQTASEMLEQFPRAADEAL